ncbi:hypothetical protein BU25DRAFT_425598 [Macroventuria anomochaeta]|uniref:Uncharacterized protein n=1 Tax=Macroventuria anomochaeta TaxID=301207 RepID=A0ACB6RMY1_9PLEO|nr:uncharacterized protein BU25DRAFT_425598 [Macroventuria anomochaeta]KAF2622662.1 hypothetical protein BU25DRAFT_425598 [Macroventuria anomochaeta]
MQLTTTILAGLCLVALALGAPSDMGSPHSTIGSTTFWENTQTQKYHCEGKDVIRCEITAGGTCSAINLCDAYCFNHDKGVACVDMGEPIMNTSSDIDTTIPKVPASAPDIKVAARYASPQENKHYICFQDRTGVLICKYGFCSTDHYCKSGAKCKDDSVSCESQSPSAKSEVRSAPNQSEDVPTKLVARNRSPKENKWYVCSKNRASVLKCAYGFCATDYYCAKRHPCIDNPARCKRALSA